MVENRKGNHANLFFEDLLGRSWLLSCYEYTPYLYQCNQAS